MADKFRTYKNLMTGKVVTLPAHYGAIFPDTLVEVDPSEHQCVDCGVPEEEVQVQDEPEVQVYDLEEPEPVRRSWLSKSAE